MISTERQARPMFVAVAGDGELATLLSTIATELDDLQAFVDQLIIRRPIGLRQAVWAHLLSGLAGIRAEHECWAIAGRADARRTMAARLWTLRAILKRIRTLRRDALSLALQHGQTVGD